MNIKAVKAFSYMDNGNLYSIGHGEIVDMDSELANTFISEGLAEAYTLITPTGTKTITENGEGIDVAEYASVDVSVSANPVLASVTVRNDDSVVWSVKGYELSNNGRVWHSTAYKNVAAGGTTNVLVPYSSNSSNAAAGIIRIRKSDFTIPDGLTVHKDGSATDLVLTDKGGEAFVLLSLINTTDVIVIEVEETQEL